jgi:hypothetical protein
MGCRLQIAVPLWKVIVDIPMSTNSNRALAGPVSFFALSLVACGWSASTRFLDASLISLRWKTL